ncbi:MAG: O-antigen ligase family protein [Anaerolineae bacterium]
MSYLTKETVLILLLSYFSLIGGGYGGLVVFESRFLTHVLAAIIVIIWLGRKALAKEDLPSTSLDIPISALLAVHLVATLFSNIPRLSLEGLYWAIMYVVLFYMVIDLLRRGWPADLFVKSLLVVGGIACLLAALEALEWYLNWLATVGLAHPIPPSSFRVAKTLGPNPLAAYLNLLIPFAVVAAVGARQRLSRLVLTSWLLLALVVQFLTLSRGGWLGLFAATTTLAIMLTLQHRSRPRIVELTKRLGRSNILTGFLITATLIAALLACLAGYRLLTHPSRRGSVEERMLMWRSGWSAFLDRPVTGTGLWTYGTQFLRYSNANLRRPVEKAHNVILTILAESGVLGLVVSVWLSGSVIGSLRRRWLTANQNQRLLVTACIASLVGSLAHGMVEDFLGFPFFTITLVLLVAVASGEGERREVRLRRRIPCRWLVGPILILLVVMFWTDIGYFHFSRGSNLATDGKWEEGAQFIERATDLDPAFPFYHFQLGFVYGHLASREGSPHLERAIEEYETGLSQEPYYSLNHANLAALYWQDGQSNIAIESVRQAIELAPATPDYVIQLGSYYEQLGSDADAIRLYETAIELSPSLIADLFWEESELRQEFIADCRSKAASDSPSSSLERGEMAYQEGRHSEAIAYFESVLATHPGNKRAQTGLGLAYLALGQEEAATYNLQVAIFWGDSREPHLALGRLAYERGDLAQAIAEFETGLTQALYSDFYGPAVYRREGIYQSRLPQLPHMGLTATLVDDYMQLAEMYEEADATARARAIYLMLLERLPQYQPALDKLELVQGS